MAYTPEEQQAHVKNICKQVSDGQSIIKVIEGDSSLPCRDTFYDWLLESQIFSDRYARACILRAEKECEYVLEIADDGRNDYYLDDKGKLQVDHENINRSRLRVDTRKWWLSKMVPKIYGDKVQHSIEGGNNGNNKGFDLSAFKPDTLELMQRDIEAAERERKVKSLTGVAILNGDVEDVQDITHTEEAAKK